jgi:hypothetical protein
MKFEFTKHGIKHDPRGAHVTFQYLGRQLLGEVVGLRRDDVLGATLLTVRHFCGDMWPVEPSARLVEVLERRAA